MTRRLVLFVVIVAMLPSGWAVADTKVVSEGRSISILNMGRAGDVKVESSVMYIGEGRLRVDRHETSLIVRGDQQKMLVLDHHAKTVSTVDLPVNMSQLLPPEVSAKMLQMMQFNVVVTPTDENKMIGQWKARRFDINMISTMVRIESKIWVSKEVDGDFDVAEVRNLYREITALQPGMAKVADELAKIDGFQVASETVIVMSAMVDKPLTSSETVVSIEDVAAEEGRYDIPEGYKVQPLDLAALTK